MNAACRYAPFLMAILLVFALLSGCGDDEDNITRTPDPPADRDFDSVPDSQDNCPSLPGEAQFSGCPWYKVDYCSGSQSYAFMPHKWGTLNPAYYCSSSIPSGWRSYVDYSAAKWNAVGSDLQIKKYNDVIGASVALDNKNVICFGPIDGDALGRTYTWFDTRTGAVVEADIRLNSNKNLTLGEGGGDFDVYSLLVHEFGHFCGLAHVSDRTHTMYPEMPSDCTIYRTLCEGDMLGLRRLY